ncbi:MAG: hypothetical protein J7M40_07815 [Planctomycetes bacterium]|nr:hypothetical protein [Planctomycetota bacterium]
MASVLSQSGEERQVNVLVFPYRDLYFQRRYGKTVRDLQIVEALRRNPGVKRVCVVNRPVSLYERLLGKRCNLLSSETDLPRYWDETSLDLLGPLQRRRWTEHCYDRLLVPVYRWAGFPADEFNVLLDFTPIAKIDHRRFPGYFYWYDLIDNFRKHNRFSLVEHQKVTEKYDYVKTHADLVTGVTEESLNDFPPERRLVVANGILERTQETVAEPGPYTFGFTGFITDKFDVKSVQELVTGTPHRVAIYGRALDKQTARRLEALPNVDLLGQFSRQDLPHIMSSFKAGLLPYRQDKSHDGSPIKLYDYLDYGKPVVSTMRFEIDNRFIIYCNPQKPQKVLGEVPKLLEALSREGNRLRRHIRATVEPAHLWANKVERILNRIGESHG